ncbi:tRNA (adenosine(37)-N6)-dimethylallyltransferase MiaA [Fulvivirga aurantia]|uniref:tRNA (adenosine(37)-N6)-dimethylallyltransferase MiaA n=1 Tax=Fulvivirga aurantia TaxID=2529383 RepID=UPI0031B588DC
MVVVGPTAVGKTDTCIKLAQHFKTDIVSADSRQFYKEMEAGTAKPSQEEMAAAKHHFIDSHSIEEDVSAGTYERLAIKQLDELFDEKKYVILTGGSGLYIDAVTMGMAEMPKIDPSIRQQLNEELDENGLQPLLEELEKLDPVYYNRVDRNNPHRIIRALEVCRGTGKAFSAFRKPAAKKRNFTTVKIGLDRPREELYERINLRMDQMIEQGLFEEAKDFYSYKNHNALQTVGYKEIFDYLDGLYDKEEAIRLLKRNSRRYAKRQMTWFTKDETVKWFHPSQIGEIIAHIEAVGM